MCWYIYPSTNGKTWYVKLNRRPESVTKRTHKLRCTVETITELCQKASSLVHWFIGCSGNTQFHSQGFFGNLIQSETLLTRWFKENNITSCFAIWRSVRRNWPFFVFYFLIFLQGLLQELVEHNLQQQSTGVVSLAQTLLMNLTSEKKSANNQLNDIICDRIKLCLTTQASNMISVCEQKWFGSVLKSIETLVS